MSAPAFDPAAFRRFEATGWEAVAEPYHRFFGPIVARAVDPLLDAARVGPGAAVLDVASGPGYVAARAAARGAAPVGLDVAPAMVALAARLHPGLAFRQGDAERPPFADGSFDAVVGSLVLHHLARPERAAAEWARVLRPGGRLAQAVWAPPDETRLLGVFLDAVQAAGAPPPADLPPGPPFFRYAPAEALAGLLRGAGLADVTVRHLAFTYLVPGADALWDGLLAGSVRTEALIRRQPPDTQRRIRAAFDRLVAGYAGDGGLAMPVAVNVAAGRKPR